MLTRRLYPALATVLGLALVASACSDGSTTPSDPTSSTTSRPDTTLVPGTAGPTTTPPDSIAPTTTVATTSTQGPGTTLPLGDAVPVFPGDDLQALVAQNPDGTHFLIKAGVHRMQSVRARPGTVFQGEEGAILNGSKLVTNWVRAGDLWVADGQDQEGRNGGQCFEDRPGCIFSNDLFIDDVALEQVTRLDDVSQGRWFFDYENDRIYIADDPAGRTVEASVTEVAIRGRVPNVTIRGLVIEKYANRAQFGAVHAIAGVWEGGIPTSAGWVVEDNIFRLNHGAGLATSDEMRVVGNKFLFNGQIGLGGAGDDVLIEDNEIAHNNTAGFSYLWEAGGAKFVKTRNLIVRNNVVHDNFGKGIWTDIDNIDSLIEDNHVYDNAHQGIYHEISYDAVIRNNLVEGNGFDHPNHLSGAGIFVTASPNVEVYGNVVLNNADGITAMQTDRGTGEYGPLELRNLYVHDNVIEMETGHTGIIDFTGNDAVFTDRNNRFDANTYRLGLGSRYYAWSGEELTTDQWIATGNDETGTWE